MSSNRLSLCVAALVVLMASGIVERAGAQATPAVPATQPAPGNTDIELGKPPTRRYAVTMLITPIIERGALLDSYHGDPMLVQEFVFNPATREVALATNSPVKQRAYGDVRIDAAAYNSDLSIFDYLTTDRAPIGKIILTCANKKLLISYNYVVSLARDRQPPIDPSTYRASVQFVKGDESNKPGTTVTVRRNSDPAAPLADNEYTKISRRNDVITWTVERGGAVVKTGSFGFPVVATDPDLVKYVIQLP